MSAAPNSTSRRYCITLWIDKTPFNEANIQQAFCGGDGNLKKPFKFVVGQLEQCPESGRRHVQSYIEFAKPQRGTKLASVLGIATDSYRFEVARGTSDQNISYCTKSESRVPGTEPFRLGEPSGGQGARTDIAEAVATLRSHGLKRCAEDHPVVYTKFHKGLGALYSMCHGPTLEFKPREVIVYWGSAGTGKTRAVYEIAKSTGSSFFRAPAASNTPWFDGYAGQDIVLFDDYGEQGKFPLTFFLQLLDGYDLQVPVKGGFVKFSPKKIYITSNQEWSSWYAPMTPSHEAALKRRITSVVEFHTNRNTIVVSDEMTGIGLVSDS